MAKNKKLDKIFETKSAESFKPKFEVNLEFFKSKILVIKISDPELRETAEAQFAQEGLLNDVFQNTSFKKHKIKKNGAYQFTFKNPASILAVLDKLQKDYPEIYQANPELNNYCKTIEKAQKQSLNKRRKSAQADSSYILPKDFEKRAKQVLGSLNEVFQLRLSKKEAKRLGFKSRNAYFKYEPNLVDSRSNEYQAVSAALFELFLGPGRVPVTRVVYDKQGIRKGTISEALPDWQPLSKFIEDVANKNIGKEIANKNISADYPWFPTDPNLYDEQRDFSAKWYYPKEMAQKLVDEGLIDVYVVNYFLVNRDAHFDNVGYHGGKLSYLDFDKVLVPIFKWRIDENSKEAVFAEWIIDSKDIGAGFVSPKVASPPRWLNKRGFSYNNAYDSKYDATPALAKRLTKVPNYLDKQFFSFLKIIVTPLDDINNCITTFEKNKKHQDRIYKYLVSRKQELYKACYDNDDFSDWLIDNAESIQQRLQTYFKDYYENTSLPVRLSAKEIEESLYKVKVLYESVVVDVQKSYEGISSDEDSLNTSNDFVNSTDGSSIDSGENSHSPDTSFAVGQEPIIDIDALKSCSIFPSSKMKSENQVSKQQENHIKYDYQVKFKG